MKMKIESRHRQGIAPLVRKNYPESPPAFGISKGDIRCGYKKERSTMKLPGNNPFGKQRPVNIRPRQPKHRWRIKWSLLLIPAAILLAAYVVSHIELAVTWDDVMDALNIRNRERYTMLATLGCLCVGCVWIAKVLRDDKKDEE